MDTSAFTRETLPDSPVEILSGSGALAQAPALLAELGVHRALLVCGRHVARLPEVTGLLAVHPGLFAGVFDGVEPDPSDRTIAAGGARAAELGADGLLAIGGGSSLDAAKAIAAEAVQCGWIAGCDRPGQPTEVPEGLLPVVAVPTTAGTASEVTPFSVITFTATRRKLALSHPAFYPRAAILDPSLLLTAPREARVAAGMDALTHAIESYLSRQATEQTRRRSLEAVEGIARHLVAATGEALDLAALAGLQRAAMVAGLAFSRSRLGIVHAMALPLSALFGVPHGMANAVLLPHGMDFNCRAAEADFGNLAALLGVYKTKDAAGAQDAAGRVRELAAAIGAPGRMRDVGVEQAAIPRMTEAALQSAHLAVNPRPVQESDVLALYAQAW
jgi:alcohol dehydrogenase class IV